MTPYYAIRNRNGQRKRYYYYRCTSTFKRHWKECSIRQVNAESIEKYVLDNLKRVSKDESYIDDLVYRTNYLNAKRASSVTCESYQPNQIGFAQGQPCSELSSEIFRENLKNLLLYIERTTPNGASKLLKNSIESIQYSKEMVKVRVYYEPLNGEVKDKMIKPDVPICITICMYIIDNELGGRKKGDN